MTQVNSYVRRTYKRGRLVYVSEIENLFGAEKQQGLWICTYDNAIVNFYGLDKDTCTKLIRKAFIEGSVDLTEYENCEWIYPEEE